MKSPSRNPLTKEMYQTTLRRRLPYELSYFVLNTLPYAGIACVLSLVAHVILTYFAPAWVIVAWVLPMLFALLYLAELGRLFYHLYLIKKDKLIVVQDTLVGMDEEQAILVGMDGLRKCTLPIRGVWAVRAQASLLHFSKYGHYALNENEYHTLERHTIGDAFYIVMYGDKKNRPALVYNTNVYELKE